VVYVDALHSHMQGQLAVAMYYFVGDLRGICQRLPHCRSAAINYIKLAD